MTAPRAFPALQHLSLPNLITSASAALGLSGLAFMVHGDVRAAVTCALLAVPCDMLDGWAARRLNQSSSFGAELDSLADATSFCVLPAIIAATLAASGFVGHGLAILYALAGLWRLAHFKEAGLVTFRGRPAFTGMPTPYAAAVLLVAIVAQRLWPAIVPPAALPGVCGLLAIWMVHGSPFPKGGWAYRLMWLLLPLAGALLWRG